MSGFPHGGRAGVFVSGWVYVYLVLTLFGCSRESLRIALETQRRADRVQQAVFDRQHDSLRVLLYRDLVSRLECGGAALTPEQRAALNDAWNDRDLVEFWGFQHERARALRVAGVDAALYGQQSAVDLLAKLVETRIDRVREHVAARAGGRLVAPSEVEDGAHR